MIKFLPFLFLAACAVQPLDLASEDSTEIHSNDINLPTRPEEINNESFGCNQNDIYPTVDGQYLAVPVACQRFYFDKGDPPPGVTDRPDMPDMSQNISQ